MEPVLFRRGCAAWEGRPPLRGRRAQAHVRARRARTRARRASSARHNGTPHPKGTRSQRFSCKPPIRKRRAASPMAPPRTPKSPRTPRVPSDPPLRFFMKPSISLPQPAPSRPLRVNGEELAAHHDIHVSVRREVRGDCISKCAGHMAVCGSAIDCSNIIVGSRWRRYLFDELV